MGLVELPIASRTVLAEVLAERLRVVSFQVQALTSASQAPTRGSEGCHSGEELLRLLMVRLLPRLRAGHTAPAAVDDVLLHLQLLREAAVDEDLRYLDAWNNVFETLEGIPHNEARRAWFLNAYEALLQSHLDRLNGRTQDGSSC